MKLSHLTAAILLATTSGAALAGGPLYLTRLVKDNLDVSCAPLSEQKRHSLLSETTSSAVAYAMPVAATAQQQWAQLSIHQRTSVLRQFLASLAANSVVNKQEPDLEQVLTLAQQKLQRVERELQQPTTLPGPTGESNTLVLDPRGILALVRDDSSSFSHWLVAIITALAAGNPFLTEMIKTNARKLLAYYRARYHYAGAIAQSAREHREIAQLIEARDADAAEAMMQRHVQFDQITAMDLLAALS